MKWSQQRHASVPTADTPLTDADLTAFTWITTTACQRTYGCSTTVSCRSNSFYRDHNNSVLSIPIAVSQLAAAEQAVFQRPQQHRTDGCYTADRCRSNSFYKDHNNSWLNWPTAVTPLTAVEQAAVPMITTTACQSTYGCSTAVSCRSNSFYMDHNSSPLPAYLWLLHLCQLQIKQLLHGSQQQPASVPVAVKPLSAEDLTAFTWIATAACQRTYGC